MLQDIAIIVSTGMVAAFGINTSYNIYRGRPWYQFTLHEVLLDGAAAILAFLF